MLERTMIGSYEGKKTDSEEVVKRKWSTQAQYHQWTCAHLQHQFKSSKLGEQELQRIRPQQSSHGKRRTK